VASDPIHGPRRGAGWGCPYKEHGIDAGQAPIEGSAIGEITLYHLDIIRKACEVRLPSQCANLTICGL
jgi:hypothetical protein